MDRLTRRKPGTGLIFCSLYGSKECEACEACVYVDSQGYTEICPYYMESKAKEHLACLEDEAEQREKGCNMCTRITPDTPDMPDICRMDTLHILWSDYAGEIHDLSDEPATYCPFCGRKLVE